MTKELFKEFITGQIERNNAILTKNSLSDDDKLAVEANIAALQSIVEKIDAMEDSEAVADDLREAVNTINDKINALNEKIEQLQSNETEQTENQMNLEENTYLKSENALHDFANVIRNSNNGAEFKKNWAEMLSTNGITISEGSEGAYLPEIVKGMITDLWDRNAEWLKDLNHTGAKRFYVRHNTSEQDAANSRAKGWKKGDTKTSQTINFAAKLIEADFIYKLVEVDKKTDWDDKSLVNYVVNELGDQILYEIKRAILVGDGRESEATGKVTSFEAIAKTSADNYTVVETASATFLVDDMVKTVNGIHNPNGKPIYAFMSKTDLTAMRRIQASETSSPVYMDIESLSAQIGVARIYTTDLLGSDYKAVFMIPDEYYLVGDPLAPEFMQQHQIYSNVDVYREELCVGGGVHGLKSTAVLKA